jgi:hypothetical protein
MAVRKRCCAVRRTAQQTPIKTSYLRCNLVFGAQIRVHATPDHIDYFSGVNQRFQAQPGSLNQGNDSSLASGKSSRSNDFGEVEKADQYDYLLPERISIGEREFKQWIPTKPFPFVVRRRSARCAKDPNTYQHPSSLPPGHAESYVPPDEYFPTEEDPRNGRKWTRKRSASCSPEEEISICDLLALTSIPSVAFERC